MPFQASFEIQGAKEWGYYEPEGRYILDTFDRPATSGTLGISTNGQTWNTLAGTWYVNSGYQAESDTAATAPYPLATYDLADLNQLGYVNVSPGMGLAFNIIDANNWYAVDNYAYFTEYSCNCQSCCSCCTCSYGCIVGQNCSQCGSSCAECKDGANLIVSCSICGTICNSCEYGCTTGANCSICGSNCNCTACNCSLCSSYYSYIDVYQNVNGTLSQVSSITLSNGSSSVSLAAAIAVQVSGNIVDYYAYSTNISGTVTTPYGLGTVLASGTFTISGSVGTQIGMIKLGSSSLQGVTTSGFFGTFL